MAEYQDFLTELLQQQVPNEVYTWIVNSLGIPYDMTTTDPRPRWVNLHRLALAWKRWDEEHSGSSEAVEDYELAIEEEWPAATK